MVTTEQVKELRDSTGISVMQCKKALEEANGNMEKALLLLKKKSSEIASKKEGRTLGSGAVQSYIHSSGNVGAMVELSCETDFVAKNEDFKTLAYDIAMHVAALNPEFLKREEVSEDVRNKMLTHFKEEADKTDKPDDIKAKIVEGQLNTYLKENSLLEQSFVKNGDMTIEDLVKEAVQKFGEKTEITRFVRFSAGQ